MKYFSFIIYFVYLPYRPFSLRLIYYYYYYYSTMNPFNLQQDFNFEQEELNFNTVFEDFLNETDTSNEDIDFVIGQGLEDTVTHIIQLDRYNELDILNEININDFNLVVNNQHLEERQPEEEDDLLQYILDLDLDYNEFDVIPYDSPMEADAIFAD